MVMGDYLKRGYDLAEECKRQGVRPGDPVDIHGDGIMAPMPGTGMHAWADDGDSETSDVRRHSTPLPAYPSPFPTVIRLYASAYKVSEPDGSTSLWAYLPYAGEPRRFVRLPMGTCGDDVRIALFPHYVPSSLSEREAKREFGPKPFRRRVISVDAEATEEAIALWDRAKSGDIRSCIGTVSTSREGVCYPPIRVVPCADAVSQSVLSLASRHMACIAKEPVQSDGNGMLVPAWRRVHEDVTVPTRATEMGIGDSFRSVWDVPEWEKRSKALSDIEGIAYELSTWLLLDRFDEGELRESIIPSFRILANLTGKVREAHVDGADPKKVLGVLASISRIGGMDAFSGIKMDAQVIHAMETADMDVTHDEARAAFDWCFSPSGEYVGNPFLLHTAMSDETVWPDVVHGMWCEFETWERSHGLDGMPTDVTAAIIGTDGGRDDSTGDGDLPRVLRLMCELSEYERVEYRYMMGTLADVAGSYAVGRVLVRGILENGEASCVSALADEQHGKADECDGANGGILREPALDDASEDATVEMGHDDWETAYPNHPDPFGYDADDDDWDDWDDPEPDYQAYEYCSVFRGVIAMVDARTRTALVKVLPGLRRFIDPETGAEPASVAKMLLDEGEE